MIKKVDHIAVAVTSIDDAARFYEEVLGLTLECVEAIAGQKTKVGFLKVGETKIELMEPIGPDSPLAKFLDTKGPGLHHISLVVDDLEKEVEAFREKGASIIDRASKVGAHGAKVAFVHPRSSGGVLIELYEPSASIKEVG